MHAANISGCVGMHVTIELSVFARAPLLLNYIISRLILATDVG